MYNDRNFTASAASGILSLLLLMIGGILALVTFLISRMDILSSALLTAVCYLLTMKQGWVTHVYIIAALVIFAGSIMLQWIFKVIRILYSVFTCVTATLITGIFITYPSDQTMYLAMGIAFCVTACISYASWVCIHE